MDFLWGIFFFIGMGTYLWGAVECIMAEASWLHWIGWTMWAIFFLLYLCGQRITSVDDGSKRKSGPSLYTLLIGLWIGSNMMDE